jgi:hypothetical protein
MYAVSRRYRFQADHAKQINDEIKEFFVPMIRSAPGFVAYYWLDNGSGTGESLSVFETKIQAESSVTMAKTWVQMHQLFEWLGVPEVISGEVKAFGTPPAPKKA